MKKRDDQREQRIALALLVRRHLIGYEDEIKAAHAKRAAAAPSGQKVSGQAVPKRHGVKTSTALATLIGLDPYDNPGKGKPEPAKHLFDFLQSAGPEHSQKIYDYFKAYVITPDYRSEAPPYVQMAIHEVFDKPWLGAIDTDTDDVVTLDGALKEALDRARHAPHAVITSIEETVPQLTSRTKLFEGTWNAIRYAHHGRRVVRLAMEVTCSDEGRPTFTLYFRTHGMTVSKSKDKYITRGSLIVLKGGQHVMFLGQEEAHEGQLEPDGYPLTIICPTKISRDGPFIGLVQRRHDDGKIFAIKAQFVRAKGKSIDDLVTDNKVGSFERDDDIARMASDIPGFQGLLAELQRPPDDVKGGLVL